MLIKRLKSDDIEIAKRAISQLKLKSNKTHDNTDYIKRLISTDSNYLIVALDDNKPVGFLIAYELNRIDGPKNMMLFYEIEVSEKYQRQGVGRLLINKLKEYCCKKDILKMWVFTGESNIAAQKLYKSTGAVQSDIPEILFEYLPE